MRATFSIIESSISGEACFFSVAMTTPFEAGPLQFHQCQSRRPALTFDAQRRCPLVHGSQRMLNLQQLAGRGEGGE
jgi:hypothetical protein